MKETPGLVPTHPRTPGFPPERSPAFAKPYLQLFLPPSVYVTCIRRLCIVPVEAKTESAK